MSFRLDYGRLDKAERSPSGGLKVPAFVTRTGVFTYRRADGTSVRELRHPDEVFNADSLASMEDAPVTIGHPGKVTPEDWEKVSVGHARDVKQDGTHVAARLVIAPRKAVDKVGQDLVEVSCGYSCDVVPKAGEYNGEKYDSIQTNIRYNHVALGPSGWGRAGSTVSLRLDSGDAIQETVSTSDTTPPVVEPPKETPTMLVTIDGKPYTHGTPEHVAALEAFQAKETARADAAEKASEASKKDAETAKGRADAAEKNLKDATDPKALSAKVQERIALQEKAAKVLGPEAKFDGKTDLEIMTEVVVKADKDFKADGKDPAYIAGRFEGALSAPRQDSVSSPRQAAKDAQTAEDPKAPKTLDQVRADQREEAENLWKQPLALSKK